LCFVIAKNRKTKKFVGENFDLVSEYVVGFLELTQQCIQNGEETFFKTGFFDRVLPHFQISFSDRTFYVGFSPANLFPKGLFRNTYILYDFQSSIFSLRRISFFESMACFLNDENRKTKKFVGENFDELSIYGRIF